MGNREDHPRDPGEIAAFGLTPAPARVVAAPRLAECRAHLECRLNSTKEYGREVIIFGQIVAASVDRAVVEQGGLASYAALRPIFYLEEWAMGVIERAVPVR